MGGGKYMCMLYVQVSCNYCDLAWAAVVAQSQGGEDNGRMRAVNAADLRALRRTLVVLYGV